VGAQEPAQTLAQLWHLCWALYLVAQHKVACLCSGLSLWVPTIPTLPSSCLYNSGLSGVGQQSTAFTGPGDWLKASDPNQANEMAGGLSTGLTAGRVRQTLAAILPLHGAGEWSQYGEEPGR
jgi:hypothetical protein